LAVWCEYIYFMGIYEYTFLSKEEQAELLWDRGLFIDSQQGTYFNRALYHLGTFYVELTVDKVTIEIVDIHAHPTPGAFAGSQHLAVAMN
jgi:hypothetical protein